jgi:hypothetical protein
MARRIAVLAAFCFWMGGFVFYAGVVVPIARRTLNPPTQQAFITNQVSVVIHLAGALALVLMFADSQTACDPHPRRVRWRRGLCLLLTAAHGLLVWAHWQISGQLDAGTGSIGPAENWYPFHRVYLLTATVQVFAASAWMILTLFAWRREDRSSSGDPAVSATGGL